MTKQKICYKKILSIDTKISNKNIRNNFTNRTKQFDKVCLKLTNFKNELKIYFCLYFNVIIIF